MSYAGKPELLHSWLTMWLSSLVDLFLNLIQTSFLKFDLKVSAEVILLTFALTYKSKFRFYNLIEIKFLLLF